MCYFQTVQFELYPERTRLHEDYYLDETEQEHKTRLSEKKKTQNATNRERNVSGQVPTFEIVEWKAAERKTPYQPKDIATIEWFPYDNPTRFTAKLLRAGDQQPMDLGTFRGEQAIDEAEAAIRDQSPDPVFVLPGRFAENVACLSPKDDRIYFDRYGN